jgi:hypothetical protein
LGPFVSYKKKCCEFLLRLSAAGLLQKVLVSFHDILRRNGEQECQIGVKKRSHFFVAIGCVGFTRRYGTQYNYI